LTTRRFDLTALPDLALAELRRRRIGFVFQFYNRIPVLDAAENAALPLLLDGSRAAAAGSALPYPSYEYFRPFSCKGFFLCPSCSQKRTLLFAEYLDE
jgi:ABC-type sugar transport system ATPase subunit